MPMYTDFIDGLQSGDEPAGRPKLLVCHDYKGGYIEESWAGCGDIASAYRLSHWRHVDVFVYFSHHLVTVPPPGWIHAAHRHGVKASVLRSFLGCCCGMSTAIEDHSGVLPCDLLETAVPFLRQVLGTFITEWDAGKDVCCQAFVSEAAAQCCAAQLADIALHCGFEGWVINIENVLPLELIPNMLVFLRCDRIVAHQGRQSHAHSLLKNNQG